MIVIKGTKMPEGCQKCKFFKKKLFGNGLDYSYSCILGATEFPMPWIRQMEERASDCPIAEDVVEREKINKAVEEIDSLFRESLNEAPCSEMEFRCGLTRAIEILEKNGVYKRDFKDLYIAVDRK